MKKTIVLLLVLVLAIAAFSGCAKPEAAANVIKIGVYEPASGDNGAGGKQETLGIQYAHSLTPTVEIGGTEYNVELVIVDNESSNDKGPAAAQTLVSEGVSLALGSYGSGVSIAASDIFKDAGIPVIGVTCTNPQVTEGNTHYFRICFLDPFQGTVLANFAKDQFQADTAYCLAKLGDDYSVGLCYYFQQAFEALGGTVINETFPEGNSDFTSYLTNAANSGAGVIFAPVSTEAAALIIEQSASQGSTLPLLAGDTWDSNVITGAAAGKGVDVFVTTFFIEGSDDPQVTEFLDGFKGWLGENPDMLTNNGGNDEVAAVTAMGFDAYYTALEALKAAGSTEAAKVNEAIWDVSYTGVTGLIEFEEPGDAIRNVAYIKKANDAGTWDYVTVQGVE